ncbi:hypothetical protein E6P09_11860 [Haloferax mediterranei ATCC 33500]|uniref:Uncharacterized protein n=1 Tax=Haloferax mediterranei (strain ATCC 33500 / DSM 1411 / JCM 8866 / NBRC 14739 / NCIMB 2177 / R-4) TaxID=523841 RepID=I3R5G0_HALMT|nr:hypothetical protein [Haloferax mediterranei]AFK19470.1 hypothetical protein HFX_1765 [Haloferax mediterranei ATCC 33500]EMA04343.1 hypothetical protein C439_01672 [Haloferax mediterranei ATCC 33500]MDX5989572.1 hypothetical protein [Haloferax mediterranei ATCC 33500]QCQ75931.1 hypothetical protein E6P09_11860 [Haloferax mediterranei ATCC 33500]
MSTDEYRRGRAVERERQGKQRPVRGRYRGVLPIIYAIGLVIFTVVSLYIGPEPAFAVYLVTHVFYAGLVRADINSLRGQGIEWGLSRHLWFGAAFALPFVAPAYYLYSRRVIRRENESRELVA